MPRNTLSLNTEVENKPDEAINLNANDSDGDADTEVHTPSINDGSSMNVDVGDSDVDSEARTPELEEVSDDDGQVRHANLDQFAYNAALKDYLVTMQRRPKKFSEMIDELGELSPQEEKILKKFEDCCTWMVPDVPVTLFGKNYNLKTLTNILETKAARYGIGKDPLRYLFTQRDIQPPNPKFVKKLESTLNQFQTVRDLKKAQEELERAQAELQRLETLHSKKRKRTEEGNHKHSFFANKKPASTATTFIEKITAPLRYFMPGVTRR